LEEALIRRIGASAVVFLLSLCAIVSYAQNATTSLRGTIKDPSGAVVPGATITLINKAAGQKITATSKGGGEYQLVQIPPAKYTITVTATGFGSQTKLAELLVNQPATVDFALTVSESNVVVDVTASAQTLNTSDASLGSSADNATIQALPSETRNVPDLLSLQPGVLFLPNSDDSRTGTVNGGRSDQGNITIDGVDDNDQVGGVAFQGVLRETQDSVEEFRVTTSNANADAGRSSGAQISLLTKSGTNKYHGAAYEYNRPTNTVANDYFNKQSQLSSQSSCYANAPDPSTVSAADLAAYLANCQKEGNRPPKLIRNTYGADVGGFIVKDKLFFFGNYEALRQNESAVITQAAPTQSYQNGTIKYVDVNGDTQTISSAQFTALDTANGCAVCNTPAYNFGPGANPNALAYINSLPTANGTIGGYGDGGYNSGSYTFSSPLPVTANTSIVRLDYTPSSKHRIFVRGNLQKDTTSQYEQFPGQGPSSSVISNNKGITAGDTWTINSNMVNDLRYGYVRAGTGNSGIGHSDFVDFRFLATPTAETRSSITSVPVNNIVDNFNITKGKHNIEFGVNWRLIHQNRSSDANSYNSASTNPFYLKGLPPSPTGVGLPNYANGFQQNYEIAYGNLVGAVPSVSDVFNYTLTSPTAGTLLPDGSAITRHFKANEYEGFVQDAWRVKPNLTVTLGVRYTILQTPWETSGQEVTPTIDTDTWYKKRESEALKGNVYEEDLSFAPAGPYYKKPGFFPKQKDNVAPRLAFAYSPNPTTSIRAGAGIYYDHFGESLVNTFDQHGEFGLSSFLRNSAGVLTVAQAPRFTDRNTIPYSVGTEPNTVSYPFQQPLGSFGINWGLDSKIKTPYSESFDLSIQQEMGSGFTLEMAYVGRFGKHLLQDLDLAEPVDFVDPQGAGDYYAAGTELSKQVDLHGGNCVYCNGEPNPTIQPIPYFEHVFPFMANQVLYDNDGNVTYNGAGLSATQNIYNLEWAPYRAQDGATTALADIDFFCGYTDGAGNCPQSKFWQDQFSSLYALSSIGTSSYNALQFTLRHPMRHGFQADINYTYSKSLDLGSDAERNNLEQGSPASFIINTWKPGLNKAVSDFNTTNLVTIDWVYQLPVGKGKHFLGTANPIVNALLGGWQSSGIARVSSGLPFSFFEPGWTTNWEIESYGVVTDKKLKAHKQFDPATGNQLYFGNTAAVNAINNGLAYGTPERLPYPGETGQRNNFRGDGYFDIDSGLSKAFSLEKYGALKVAWEVYNVTNSARFDPFSIGSGLTGNLGTAGSLLTQNRRMQFSLRYDF
jgi:hypothetical protein